MRFYMYINAYIVLVVIIEKHLSCTFLFHVNTFGSCDRYRRRADCELTQSIHHYTIPIYIQVNTQREIRVLCSQKGATNKLSTFGQNVMTEQSPPQMALLRTHKHTKNTVRLYINTKIRQKFVDPSLMFL